MFLDLVDSEWRRYRRRYRNPNQRGRHLSGLLLQTTSNYRTFIKQLTAFADKRGYVFMDQSNADDVDVFHATWALSPGTKTKRLATFRAFFRFCAARRWLASALEEFATRLQASAAGEMRRRTRKHRQMVSIGRRPDRLYTSHHSQHQLDGLSAEASVTMRANPGDGIADSPEHHEPRHKNMTPGSLSNIERINTLRNRFVGKQCIVMCSGPSIEKVDLAAVDGHPHIMGVNGTFLLRNRFSHYFCSDLAFTRSNMQRIAKIDSDYFIFRQEVHHDCVAAGIDINKTIFLAGDRNVVSNEIQVDLTQRLPWGPTVLLGVVFPTLIWEGFEEIILLGADFPRKNYRRFYDAKGGGAIHRNMGSQGLELEMKLAHIRLQLWANYLKEHHPKVVVLNCSLESQTEVFPKVEFRSVPLRF